MLKGARGALHRADAMWLAFAAGQLKRPHAAAVRENSGGHRVRMVVFWRKQTRTERWTVWGPTRGVYRYLRISGFGYPDISVVYKLGLQFKRVSHIFRTHFLLNDGHGFQNISGISTVWKVWLFALLRHHFGCFALPTFQVDWCRCASRDTAQRT